MFNLFKKKEEEKTTDEPSTREIFVATINLYDGRRETICDYYPSANYFSIRIHNSLELNDWFKGIKLNGDIILIRSKDVESIEVEAKPYDDESNEETD